MADDSNDSQSPVQSLLDRSRRFRRISEVFGWIAAVGLAVLAAWIVMRLVAMGSGRKRQAANPPPPAQVAPAPAPDSLSTTPPPQPAVTLGPVPTSQPASPPAPRLARTRPSLGRPYAVAMPIPADGVSDDQTGLAISRASHYLLAQFENGKLRDLPMKDSRDVGADALAVYALLQSCQAMYDPKLDFRKQPMKDMLSALAAMDIQGSTETYARSLRLAALALHSRKEDMPTLRADLAWLVRAHRRGAYGYQSPDPTAELAHWDNSNSQYGLLGVWAAAEAGLDVPASYWTSVQNHWFECRLPDGLWGYMPGDGSPRISMTLAALVSMAVTQDQLESRRDGLRTSRQPYPRPLAEGLAWLDAGDNCLQAWSGDLGYTLYGLERVALASGYKYFGKHDWYRELSGKLIAKQENDGSWLFAGDSVVQSSFYLLFLARARHPVVMNKLRAAGAWNNRPRDLLNLARVAARDMERPLNWQIVPTFVEWHSWMDCPVLYLASHAPLGITESECEKLRAFALAGGLIFTHADGGSESFTQYIRELAGRLFPQHPIDDLPVDHELYTLGFRVPPDQPLLAVSNGSRLLLVHSPKDITQHWHLRSDKTHREAFHMGLNIFLYAAGTTDLRNRLDSPYIPAPPAQRREYSINIARICHNGRWDPEPYAFERFARWFTWQTGYELKVEAVDPRQLLPQRHRLAHLTGNAPATFTDEHSEALRQYVAAGGVLLIDACGASKEFAAGITRDLLPRAFPDARLSPVAATQPFLAGSGDGMNKLPAAVLRPRTQQKLGPDSATLRGFRHGKGYVIFTPLDLTTALLGTRHWTITGFEPDYAMPLLKNLLLWTADNCPAPATSQPSTAPEPTAPATPA